MGELTCKERLARNFSRTMIELRDMVWDDSILTDTEKYMELKAYALGFDFVAAGDVGNAVPFWRWQLSWGGPQDEFRFPYEDSVTKYGGDAARAFSSNDGLVYAGVHQQKCEYWFLDWGDCAHCNVLGHDLIIMQKVLRYYAETGEVLEAFRNARGIPVHADRVVKEPLSERIMRIRNEQPKTS
jgi:hypothetical protein